MGRGRSGRSLSPTGRRADRPLRSAEAHKAPEATVSVFVVSIPSGILIAQAGGKVSRALMVSVPEWTVSLAC